MMLTRAMRVKLAGFDPDGGVNRSTSAVPSQLFPAKTTGVVVVACVALTAGAEADPTALTAPAVSTAIAAIARRRRFGRTVPLRPLTSYLPSLPSDRSGARRLARRFTRP